MANLLDEASIFLTPTAYNNGRMLAVKPEIALGVDLADGWTFTSGWNPFGGGTSVTNSTTFISESGQGIYTGLGLVAGKKYKILISGTQPSGGYLSIKAGTTGTSFGNITEQSFDKIIYVTPSTVTGVGNSFYIRLASHAVNTSINITKLQIQEDLSGDFTFSRNSAATRVNAQGLVENVQILSSNLVSNSDFSQEGVQEVSNGSFSQEGVEGVSNGDFSNGINGWSSHAGSTLELENGMAKVTTVSAQGFIRRTDLSIETGKTYFCKAYITNGLAPQWYINGTGNLINLSLISENTYAGYVTTTGNNSYFYIRGNNTDGEVSYIDNVSVKEVGQDWNVNGGNYASFANDVLNSNNPQNGSWHTQNVSQNISFVNGKTYKVFFKAKNISGNLNLRLTQGANVIINYNLTSSFVDYEVFYTANADNGALKIFCNDNVGQFEITNISVKEVGQNWTLGTKWSIGNGFAQLISNDSTGSSLIPNTVVISGNKYKCSFDVVINSGSCKFQSASGTTYQTIDETKTYNFNFIADSGDMYFNRSSSVSDITITNISVLEITDDTNLPRINYEGFSYQDSLGSELVVNGDFSDGSANWNLGTNFSIADGKLKSINTANAAITNQSAFVFTIGKSYKLTFDISDYVEGNVRILFGGFNSGDFNSNGTFSVIGVANRVDEILIMSIGSNNTYSLDNVSVKEYLGQEVVPNSGCGSWLLEPQRTNAIAYSSDFTQWGLKTNVTIDSNISISPDGTLNADRITFNGTTNARVETNAQGIDNFEGTKSRPNSVWLKTESGTTTVQFGSSSAWLSTVTVTEEWQRFTHNSRQGFARIRSDNATSVLAWGYQFETNGDVGLSYETSYIPTSGAISTRLQDIANNSGNSSLINSEEGVLYFEASALSDDLTNRLITISNGTTNNRLIIQHNSASNSISCNMVVGGSARGVINYVATDITSFNKIAVRYSATNFDLYVNGILRDSGGSGSVMVANTMNELQFANYNGTLNYYGNTKALAVYKTALTDASLRSLTYPSAVATTFDLDFNTIADDFTFTRGSEATFVNAQGLIQSTASNDAPRLDYSTGSEAFLLEPQSTNLITYSEDFSQSVWAKGRVSITPNTLKSPDGSINASTLSVTSATGGEEYLRVQSNDANEATCSFYVKKGNWRYIRIRSVNASIFDFDTETFTFTGTNEIVSFDKLQNGWYRLKASSPTRIYCSIGFATSATTPSGGSGVNGSNMYIWGAQLEQQSYATSYIPTSGASATRNQELCKDATPVINSEEGTLYFEGSVLEEGSLGRYITISDGVVNSNAIRLLYHNSNAVYFQKYVNGVRTTNISTTSITKTDFNKIAIRYNSTEISVFVNGVNILNNADTNVMLPNTLNVLGFAAGEGYNKFFGNTKGLKYYPKALADVQLEDLTTI